MFPVIVIVGRPNVGKSTLFNCLTDSRAALVADEPGVTRDRKYGEGVFEEKQFIVVDTGGLGEEQEAANAIANQAWEAIKEGDIILFVVDGKEGLTAADEDIAEKLRRSQKRIILAVNKTDGVNLDVGLADFYKLGFDIVPIAAVHRRGITVLLQDALKDFPEFQADQDKKEESGIKIAFIGRPNVGKSTLVNRILGEERVITYDQPGTTRDSIAIPFCRQSKNYTLIDTAGIRRRGRVKEVVEKFSVIKALQAIKATDVVVLVVDARNNIAEQDLRLLGFILDAGKALVVAINKWDGMTQFEKESVRKELDRRLSFINFAEIFYISALNGTGVGKLFPAIHRAYGSATRKVQTPKLTNILRQLIKEHEPPLVRGRRIKLLYAHAGGQCPPVIVIHGRQIKNIPDPYRRYLANSFRKILGLVGTPVRIEFKEGENPYKGKKNILTERQIRKRKRIIAKHK